MIIAHVEHEPAAGVEGRGDDPVGVRCEKEARVVRRRDRIDPLLFDEQHVLRHHGLEHHRRGVIAGPEHFIAEHVEALEKVRVEAAREVGALNEVLTVRREEKAQEVPQCAFPAPCFPRSTTATWPGLSRCWTHHAEKGDQVVVVRVDAITDHVVQMRPEERPRTRCGREPQPR